MIAKAPTKTAAASNLRMVASNDQKLLESAKSFDVGHVEFADVDEVAGNRGSGSHHRAY